MYRILEVAVSAECESRVRIIQLRIGACRKFSRFTFSHFLSLSFFSFLRP